MIALLLHHPMPICEAGLGIVYASLAVLSRKQKAHACVYCAAAMLAMTLAACAAMQG